VKLVNINGFDNGDRVTLLNAPAGTDFGYGSSTADSNDFVAGDVVSFSNAWAVTFGDQDAVEVATFVAAADQKAALDAAWGADWLVA
jgi:hypothetical protein